jgi:acyl carrier protein
VNLYLQPGSFSDDLSNLVRQVEERFMTIAGIITSPDTAESSHSILLSIETWLKEYMPEFVWCLTKREKGIAETLRKTEANLEFLTKQLEQEIGISAMSVRLDDREWTEGEQAQAVCELIGTPLTQAVIASRKEFAQDLVLMSTDPEETQNQSLNNIPIRSENRDPNNIEQEIKQIWEEVFGIESIGIHDDFFEIGGHSLLAIQLMTRIREYFNIEIELETMFDEPTVAGLVKQVVETLQIGHAQSESQEESIDELELLLQEIEGQSDKEIEKVLNKLNS